MANETLKFCDLGPAIIGDEKHRELNAQVGGVGGASDLGAAFLSPPEPVKEEAPAPAPNAVPKAVPKAAPKKRAR